MIRPATLLLLTASLAATGCVETVAVRQAQSPLPNVLVSTPRAAWQVVAGGGAESGYVLRFEATEDGRAFHSVRNVWNQELGLVDADGRAWRYRPHGRDPEWLGTGPVSQGATRILGLENASLEPVGLDQLRNR